MAEPQGINDVWGTEVSATQNRYDCDGDSIEETCYTLTFLREEVLGARLELQDEDRERGQAMVEGILSRLLDPQRSVSLDFLTPEEIPAWRYERLTMEEARQEPDFAAYFPEHIPEDFQPEEAWLDMGQGRYSLRLCWSRGSNTISVCINRMAEVPASQFADLQEPASYDLRLYPIPRGDSIPDLYWDSIQDPVFRAEDVTQALLEARADPILAEEKTHFPAPDSSRRRRIGAIQPGCQSYRAMGHGRAHLAGSISDANEQGAFRKAGTLPVFFGIMPPFVCPESLPPSAPASGPPRPAGSPLHP